MEAGRPLNVRGVAAHYGVSTDTVYAWLQRGQLGHLRLPGGDYRVRPADLEAFDKAGGPPPPRKSPGAPTILQRVEQEFVPAIDPGAPEFIYFIRVGGRGPIKIGRATNVARRLASLQCANHQPLELLGTMKGNAALEASLHRRFKRFRLGGEWFRPAKSLLRLIEELPAK